MFLRTAAAVIVALAAAPGNAQNSGRAFDVAGFYSVELIGADDVRIVAGESVSVVATGDPRAVAALAIAVHGTTLSIGRRPGNWRDKGALVTVTAPSVRALSLSGSGSIVATGIGGPQLAAQVSGSGDIHLVGLHARHVHLQLSGSGSILAAGSAQAASIDLGGSGDIDTRALATSDLDVALGGSGDVRSVATRTARVNGNGSGSVVVGGGASCSVSSGGSGSVSCR